MQNREVSVLRGSPVSYFNTGRQYSQTSLIRMSKVPALQRCPNYKGESCMSFVVFGTENCVRIIEVYIRRGSTVITDLIQTTPRFSSLKNDDHIIHKTDNTVY